MGCVFVLYRLYKCCVGKCRFGNPRREVRSVKMMMVIYQEEVKS